MPITIKAEMKELRQKLQQGVMTYDDSMRMLALEFGQRVKGPIKTQIHKAYPGQQTGRIPEPSVRVSGYEAELNYSYNGWQSIKHFGLSGGPVGYTRSGKQRWPVKPIPYTMSFNIKGGVTIGGQGSGVFLGAGRLNDHIYMREANSAKSPLKRVNVISVPVMITNDAKEGITQRVQEILEKRAQHALNNIFK